MYKKFRRKLLLLLTVFSLIIISLLSYTDMKRVNSHLKSNYIERMKLAEMSVKTALYHWNEEYQLLDQKIADQMRANSEWLLEKYHDNPQVENWDYEALKKKFGMDVYIINKENTVIYSSFKPDIGLNFNECCQPFSALLTDRREKGKFIHDVIDLQKDVGELKKFSYMPTDDGKYILELSYNIERDPEFRKFSFVSIMNELKTDYPFIKNISIFNGDYYTFHRSTINKWDSKHNQDSYNNWLITSDTLKDSNYILLNSPVEKISDSTKVLVIDYDHSVLEDEIEESLIYFYLSILQN